MRVLIFVAIALAAGCKKDKAAGKRDDSTPTAPVSTAAQDALWALAPDGAMFGIVVSPRGLAMIESGAVELKRLTDAAPELAPAKAELDKMLQEALGTTNPSLAAAGLSRDKGFAMFAVGDESAIAIVPLADRAKFIEVTKGQQGDDGDRVGRATCKTIGDVYACTRDATLFARLGKGNMTDALRLAGARGDIEIAGTLPAQSPLPVAAVMQLSRGTVVVRGAVKGIPAQALATLANARPRVDGDKTSGFGLLHIAPMLAQLPVPPLPLAPGVSADELARSIKGPLTVTSSTDATPMFDIRVPLAAPGPAEKLIAQCNTIAPLQMLGATAKDGVCHVTVPQMLLELDAWVEASQLRIGRKGVQPSGPAVQMSAVTKELATGEWFLAFSGRGTMLAPMQIPPMPPSALPDEALMGIRAMAMLSELGIGVRVDGDAVRFLANLRTAWANPDGVLEELIAIAPDQILSGQGATKAKAIVAAAPTSPFAADYASGYGGLMMPVAAIGVVAAIAIPAFMDYTKKSKVTEASLRLNMIAKQLKFVHASDGAFPKGTTPMTPARSCCDYPGGRCNDATAWNDPIWKQLDTQLDEPHLFRYQYQSEDGRSFVVTAVGDLDCDGTEITYVLTGSVGAQGQISTTMVAPAPNTD